MARVGGEGGDLTENALSEQLLNENKPTSSNKANFMAGYLKGGKDKVLQTLTSEHVEVTCRMTLAMRWYSWFDGRSFLSTEYDRRMPMPE